MRLLLRIDPLQLQKTDHEIATVTTPTYKLMIVCVTGLMFLAASMGLCAAWLFVALGLGNFSIIAMAGLMAVFGFVLLCKPDWFTRFVKRGNDR